ncbi:CHC2 zinc finger domain-containing protein [Qingrenia yutianensis]|uniref:Zinc finger CHC2-type domain-containing protein n=1 Tax=Qingrenia yutianensis TaxID=2763676 RepID=A0A926ITL2_9FIRM|nr:CHC2 zinc finger domain-containing protein [Qingrenia yutianensis]MBC8597226.1 hypothetical protein [Qingrenia yutianensis]
MTDILGRIKENVKMSELLAKYGFKIEKGGAVCCPFHNEKTPSFKIYKNGTRYHCFGCGESGDVVTFVMKYCGIDFKQAIARINYEFNLNLQGGKNLTLRENVKRSKEIAKRNELKNRIVRLKEVIDIAYSLLCKAERKRRENIPKSNADINEIYVRSLHEIDLYEFEISYYESEVENLERESAELYKRGFSDRHKAV